MFFLRTTKRYFLRFLAVFLAFAMMLSLSPLTMTASADESALPGLISDYIQSKRINSNNISIGYYNTVSGEEYLWNSGKYYIAASLYKLPLNMYYYEMEAAGEISPEARIGGYALSYCHKESLQNSNNVVSQAMRAYLGSYEQYKTLMARYGGIPLESLPDMYFSANYYNADFILNTLKILYERQDFFSEAIGYLKNAQPGRYFETRLRDSECTVAQKYGFLASSGVIHDAGIFYADEPFLLVVFTQNVGYAENVLGDIARICYDYTQANLGNWRETVLGFKDVYATDWYAEVVAYCAEHGIMNGTSATTFSPYDALTRGMFITMLGRFAGAAASSFADVDYFSAYVEWAYKNGIASGVDTTSFAPNAPITREQAAVMLYRYLTMEGLDPAGGDQSVGQFRDDAAISDYAKEAANVLHAYGVFLGDSEGYFTPLSNFTRAEAAALFMRLDQNVATLLNPAAADDDDATADTPEDETTDTSEEETADASTEEAADPSAEEAADAPEGDEGTLTTTAAEMSEENGETLITTAEVSDVLPDP